MFENEKSNIWEAYKLSADENLIVQHVGIWKVDSGLDMTDDEKWHRRGDLQGYKFKCATLVSIPYVTEMTSKGQNLWEMQGKIAEVFENLMVHTTLIYIFC